MASKLHVFTRRDLAGGASLDGRPAVLLEGSWPACPGPVPCESLDAAMDGRHDWIDEEAARCADEAAPADDDAGRPLCGITGAWLDALALRYALVKWIRVVAFFTEVRPLGPGGEVQLIATGNRDEDYAYLLERLCARAGAGFRVRWAGKRPSCGPRFPPNRGLRRLAGWAAEGCQPRVAGGDRRAPVVLCGNPRLLDPVCAELLARRVKVWWLYDRFAVRSWIRWRAAGVGQLTCNASLGDVNRLPEPSLPPVSCRDIDLSTVIARWLRERLAARGAQYTRLIGQIDDHFRRVRPRAVILDQDATPMARAVVAAGRRHGARSWVVQHGAPCGRFGFSPLVANRILVWGESSAAQLTRWGVPPRRILATGSPWHDRLYRNLAPLRHRAAARPPTHGRRGHGPRILLLATVPPRDERPDLLTQRFTVQTHAEMLRMALAAVAKLPGARLLVKPHPRAPRDPVVETMLARYRSVRGRVIRKGSLERWLAGTDCVLSCMSSAGIDATLAGVPVIQLLPRGSGNMLPYAAWGLVGTARTESELDRLLARVFDPEFSARSELDPGVFGSFEQPAAARIAEAVLFTDRHAGQGPHFSTVSARRPFMPTPSPRKG